MNVIIMPYRYRNKKVFLVARISSHCHTLYTSYNISELSRQTDELDPLGSGPINFIEAFKPL